ncbi:MAG: PolC-type DNA polymerase III [Deinococcales bacterium]
MEFVVFDLETTGLSPERDAILEIGALVVRDEQITNESFQTLVYPRRSIPFYISRINGITDRMVQGAPTIEDALPRFFEFVAGRQLVAHNAEFDIGFVRSNAARLGLNAPLRATCTVQLSRRAFPTEKNHSLDAVCARLGLVASQRHRALADVEVTAQAFLEFRRRLLFR